MTVNLGSIIWTAVRAILKFVITASFGTLLARSKLLDSTGTRAISQCVLNVFLPCLLFTKIVQGIDQSNIRQVGVLALTAILYTVIGLASGYVVKVLTKVPRGWQSGVLAAGAFSNWGDLPLVVIGTIVTAAPFGGATDEAKGLAYVAVYMFVQSTIMFVCNGVWLISRDYNHPIEEETEPRSIVEKLKQVNTQVTNLKRRAMSSRRVTRSIKKRASTAETLSDLENNDECIVNTTDKEGTQSMARATTDPRALRRGDSLGLARRPSADSLFLRPITSGVLDHGDIHSTIDPLTITRLPSTAPPLARTGLQFTESNDTPPSASDESDSHGSRIRKWRWSRASIWASTKSTLLRLLSPPSAAVLSGFIIAIIPTLKALFVTVKGVSMPTAPDGFPPLDFILDISNFIGSASVPSSLLILGYSLSRLQVKKLPALSAALVMGLLKMIVLPIIAIAWMQFIAGPNGVQLVDSSDLVLRLVLVLPSAVPTATSLLYITQIFAPEGRDEGVACLSVFLIVQYLMVGFTLTVTVVYTLNIIT